MSRFTGDIGRANAAYIGTIGPIPGMCQSTGTDPTTVTTITADIIPATDPIIAVMDITADTTETRPVIQHSIVELR